MDCSEPVDLEVVARRGRWFAVLNRDGVLALGEPVAQRISPGSCPATKLSRCHGSSALSFLRTKPVVHEPSVTDVGAREMEATPRMARPHAHSRSE